MAVYIQNRIEDKVSIHGLYFKRNLRILGSRAYVHVPYEKQRKLDPKLEKCILVGYSLEQKGYNRYNHRTKKVRVNRDVEFDETSSWYSLLTPTADSNPIPDDEAEREDEEFGALEESPESFRLSGPNE